MKHVTPKQAASDLAKINKKLKAVRLLINDNKPKRNE